MNGLATKKPIEVCWFKWEDDIKELVKWVKTFDQNPLNHFELFYGMKNNGLRIKTLEGSSYEVPVGYIVVRGVEGEYWPCDPEIFKKTYDVKG